MSNTLILFFVFFVIDLVFTSLRAAMIHARLPHLISMREHQPGVVDRTIRFLNDPRLRVTLRVVTGLVHFVLAVLAWMVLVNIFAIVPSAGTAVGLLLLVGLVVIGLEYGLEGIVLRHPETWALRMLWLGQLLDFILRPFSALFIRLLGSPAALQRQLSSVTDDELRNWVEDEQPESTLEKGERKMIYSIFQFGETLCREIMVPRIDVYGLEVNTSQQEAIEAFTRSGHSRIPVYADSIDNILGILYAKDLLRVNMKPGGPDLIRKLLRPPYYVPEAKKVDELLGEMQLRGVHMAIVVDEYGGTAGIVTLEDIVEEIVGEIRDEYDQGEEQLYQEVSQDEFSFIGRIDLDDVNELLGTHLTKDVADTLGGYIYGKIGRVPTGGEELEEDDWILTVEQISGRRIRMVRARRKPDGQAVEESTEDVNHRDQTKSD